MTEENLQEEGWESVEGYLNEEIECGFNMAVIEVHKKLAEILSQKKFPGKKFEDKLKSAKPVLTDWERLNEAIEQREKMLNELDFKLSQEGAREIISIYYQAIVDIRDYVKKDDLRFWERWRLILKRIDIRLGRWIKFLIGGIFLFFFIVFLLDRTQIGKDMVLEIVKLANFIFTKLIIGVFVGAAVLLLLVGVVYQLSSKKEVGIDDNEEEDNDE